MLLCALGSHADSALSANEKAAARKLYLSKCAKCHELYEPKRYSVTDWDAWLTRMSKKSKLKEDQEKLLKQYLDDYRAGKIAEAH